MRLLGDPQLPNGVSDESVRIEARTTLFATAAGLLVDGVPAAVHRHEVVNIAGEAIVLLGASDRFAHALHALDAWTQARRSRSTPTGAGCGRRRRWWRNGCATPSRCSPSDTTAAVAHADDVEGWLKLTGYAGDAAATAQAQRCRAVDTLTDGGETLAAARRS